MLKSKVKPTNQVKKKKPFFPCHSVSPPISQWKSQNYGRLCFHSDLHKKQRRRSTATRCDRTADKHHSDRRGRSDARVEATNPIKAHHFPESESFPLQLRNHVHRHVLDPRARRGGAPGGPNLLPAATASDPEAPLSAGPLRSGHQGQLCAGQRRWSPNFEAQISLNFYFLDIKFFLIFVIEFSDVVKHILTSCDEKIGDHFSIFPASKAGCVCKNEAGIIWQGGGLHVGTGPTQLSYLGLSHTKLGPNLHW